MNELYLSLTLVISTVKSNQEVLNIVLHLSTHTHAHAHTHIHTHIHTHTHTHTHILVYTCMNTQYTQTKNKKQKKISSKSDCTCLLAREAHSSLIALKCTYTAGNSKGRKTTTTSTLSSQSSSLQKEGWVLDW